MVHKFIHESLNVSHIFRTKSKKFKATGSNIVPTSLTTAPAVFFGNVKTPCDLELGEIKRYFLLCSLIKIITKADDRLFCLNHNLIKCEFSKHEAARLRTLLDGESDSRKKCVSTFATEIVGKFHVANASIGYISSSSLDSNYLSNATNCAAAQSFLQKVHRIRLSNQKSIEDTILNNLEYVRQEICVTLSLLEGLTTNQLLPLPSVALGVLRFTSIYLELYQMFRQIIL